MEKKEAWHDSINLSLDIEDDVGVPFRVDELLFQMFKDEHEDKIHVGAFLTALMETGLRKNDHRLKEMFSNLNSIQMHTSADLSGLGAAFKSKDRPSDQLGSGASSPTPQRRSRRHTLTPTGAGSPSYSSHNTMASMMLSSTEFKEVIKDNIALIAKALRHKMVIPEWCQFVETIQDFYDYCSQFTDGKVASYIPQLARFDPNLFGVSVCTTDGQRMSVGDTDVPFTMQSCSKPLTYAIALNELGSEIVHNYVGQEPSGRMFNAIALDYNDKPHNPLVNAGSIVTNALLYSLVESNMAPSEKFDFIQNYFRRMAGNEAVGFSNGTFLSERAHADRNYALGYYMRENKCFPKNCDLMASLDLYFQCCSMEVNTEVMSVIAATLANGGICPTSGEKILEPNAVRDVLSLMNSCGMYDYSGQFAFKVGLPAKSGVCGAIILVIPNVMGVCIWAPPLDSLGNSVKGIKFCEKMVEVFNFHRYDNLRHAVNKKDPRRQRFESRGAKLVSLLYSASIGDVSTLRRATLSGIDMEEDDYNGRTALHQAAIEGQIEAVKFLLNRCRVNPKLKDRWNRTPADDAEQSGHAEIQKIIEDASKDHPGEE